MIAINKPNIFGNEYKYIKNSIKNGWLASVGKNVFKFEKNIAKFTKSKYSVSCNSGTSALHIALKIFVKNNDEVLVPSITFISTINSINYNNCYPVFMDVNDSFNIDEKKTIEFLKKNTFQKNKICLNKKTKRKISAIVIVSVWGIPPQVNKLINECKKRNIKIIEDATEALGSFYKNGKFKGKHAGTLGDIGCYSFNGNKIITTGGGGMIVSNNKKLILKSKYFINQCKDDATNYVHNEIGYNYRLSSLQASLGLAQLKKLNLIIKKKVKIYNYYRKKLINLKKFSLFQFPDHSKNNHWINILNIKSEIKNSLNLKNKLLKKFKINGIEARSIWFPNHLQKPYRNCEKYKIKNAVKLFKSSVCLPSSFNLNLKDQNFIIKIIKELDV